MDSRGDFQEVETADDRELCECLIVWIRTFSPPSSCNEVSDLTDGMVLCFCLNKIDSNFFDDMWQSSLAPETSNWRLKASNLRRIVQGMRDYYTFYIHKGLTDFPYPDVERIAELSDIKHCGRLLQLFLGCAMYCDYKQDYIERILHLDERVQHVVMNAIQDLIDMEFEVDEGEDSKTDDSLSDYRLKRSLEDSQRLSLENRQLINKLHESESLKQLIDEEKSQLKLENLKLRGEDSGAESVYPGDTRQYQQLHSKAEQLLAENYRVEASREDLLMKNEAYETSIKELQAKVEEFEVLAKHSQEFKDELDVLRNNSDKMAKYEREIDQYKKKLSEMADTRKQMRQLEDKNSEYVRVNVELEEELGRAQVYRAQCESYKVQLQDAQSRILEDSKAIDKGEFEAKKLQEKIKHLNDIVDKLRKDNEDLKDIVEDLDGNDASYDRLNTSGRPMSASPMLELIPSEVRERIVKLQHENESLRSQLANRTGEQVAVLQCVADDARARVEDLEGELREANQKVIRLESEVEDYKVAAKSTSSVDELEKRWKKRHNDLQERNNWLQTENQRQNKSLIALDKKIVSANARIDGLNEQLAKNEHEKGVMEERYRKYLEKARSVIKTLDPRHNPQIVGDLENLRSANREMEQRIKQLETERERQKVARESEEKLIVSAWYNMGMQVHRRSVEDRLSGSSFHRVPGSSNDRYSSASGPTSRYRSSHPP